MPHPQLDSAQGAAKVPSMVRKLISSAMRSTVEELLSKPLHDLAEGQKALMVGLQEVRFALGAQSGRIDALGARLDQRIDAQGNNLNLRIDGLSARMDEMSTQQNRLTAEVAGLKIDVASLKTDVAGVKTEVVSLKRDRDSADDQAHRITRIEDRVFSQ